MTVVYGVVAAVLAALGTRALVYWGRRPFETTDVRDHLWYAAYLTGRIGLWFALAAFFIALAAGARRFATVARDAAKSRWFVMLFLALAVLEMVAGYFLGRRTQTFPPPQPDREQPGPNGGGPSD